MKSNLSNKQWTRILGFQIGQKVRIIYPFWFNGRKLKGRKGSIIKIEFDTSRSFIIYYTKVNWIKGEFQFLEQEIEPV